MFLEDIWPNLQYTVAHKYTKYRFPNIVIAFLFQDFRQRNIDSRTRRRQKIRAKYDALRAQGKWYDPEAWPGLVGEALEWVKEWQTRDQTRINSMVDPAPKTKN